MHGPVTAKCRTNHNCQTEKFIQYHRKFQVTNTRSFRPHYNLQQINSTTNLDELNTYSDTELRTIISLHRVEKQQQRSLCSFLMWSPSIPRHHQLEVYKNVCAGNDSWLWVSHMYCPASLLTQFWWCWRCWWLQVRVLHNKLKSL